MTRAWAIALSLILLSAPARAAKNPFAGMEDEDMVASMEAAVESKKADANYINAMITQLSNDEAGVRVRERAAWALGELNAKTAIPALVKATEHKGLLIRSAALGALQRLRPAAALPAFIRIAETDPILPLRQRATVGLGLFRSDKAIPALVALSSDANPEVRGAAALAMAATHSKKSDFSEALAEMTADESGYVKDRAERGLEIARGETPKVLDQLRSSDSDIRLIAALYFEQRGGSRELVTLKDAWNTDPDDDVRHQLERSILSTKKRVAEQKAAQEKARKEKAAKAAAGAAGSAKPKAPAATKPVAAPKAP